MYIYICVYIYHPPPGRPRHKAGPEHGQYRVYVYIYIYIWVYIYMCVYTYIYTPSGRPRHRAGPKHGRDRDNHQLLKYINI